MYEIPDFLFLIFSHPSVQGIVQWGFWDKVSLLQGLQVRLTSGVLQFSVQCTAIQL